MGKGTCGMCGGSGQLGVRQKDGSMKWFKCGECRGSGKA
jgi:DnaJ-class molecular chaperone